MSIILQTQDADGDRFMVGDYVYNHVDKCYGEIEKIVKEGVVKCRWEDDGTTSEVTVNYLTVERS